MKTFALFVAPWDLADRGTRELFTWAAEQGVNTIYLASEYHAGWFLHPHARSRKVFMAEEGVCYFHPVLNVYHQTELKPLVAAMAKDKDWIGEARGCANELGLKLFLWTVCLHNTRLGLLHPKTACRNAFGDIYPHSLCPSHPDIRAYVRALIRDQATQYRPDGFFLEATQYRGRAHGHHHERDGLALSPLDNHLLDLSFSETDVAGAGAAGIDAERLQRRVCEHLTKSFSIEPRPFVSAAKAFNRFRESVPDLERYEMWQEQVCESLLAEIRGDFPSTQSPPLLLGAGHRNLDQLFVAVYNQAVNQVEDAIAQATATRHANQRVIAGLRLGFNSAPSVAAINSSAQANEIAQAASSTDIEGLAFYMYGEAPTSSLEWIAPAIAAARAGDLARRVRQTRPSDGAADVVRVGLIGAGSAGVCHMLSMRQVSGVKLVGVADMNIVKARQAAERLDLRIARQDPEELLDQSDIDLVVVATPPRFHKDIAISALQHGKHLLLEKPFGMNAKQTGDIFRVARDHPECIFAGALVHRYSGARFAVRNLIRAGAIGQVRVVRHRYGINMYGDPRFVRPLRDERGWLTDPTQSSGGILPSASIHSLSAVSFLLDDPAYQTVRGSIRQLHPNAIDGIEDHASLSFMLQGDVEFQFEESWAFDAPYETTVHGDCGWLRMSGPNFEDIAVDGECDGTVSPDLLKYCDGSRIQARPHELDALSPSFFHGLAMDVIRVCCGKTSSALPGIDHALNMRNIIDTALSSSSNDTIENIPWISSHVRGADPIGQEIYQQNA